LACRDRSRENAAIGIRPRDATANSLNADSAGFGIRQQYPPHRKDTMNFAALQGFGGYPLCGHSEKKVDLESGAAGDGPTAPIFIQE
jgi:hypothetical protein